MTSVELRREGATEAGRLFAEYSERLLGYCLRQLDSRSEAEDAVQTTFLYAHRALQRGVVPESESAWLFAIAKNVCRWQKRTSARHPSVSRDLDVEALESPRRDDGEDGDLLIGLDDALGAIPERQRHALLLREWRGLSCPEIASRLGLSESATHALITRGRRSLAFALTAARQPALGLAWLVFELRRQLRALLAGGSAKAAATAALAVGVGVGGVSVERTLDGGHPEPLGPASASQTDPGAEAVEPDGSPLRTAAVPQDGIGRHLPAKPGWALPTVRTTPSTDPSPFGSETADGTNVAVPSLPHSLPPDPALDDRSAPDLPTVPAEPVAGLLEDLPLDLPPLPDVDPTVELEPPAVPLPDPPAVPDLPLDDLPLPALPEVESSILP